MENKRKLFHLLLLFFACAITEAQTTKNFTYSTSTLNMAPTNGNLRGASLSLRDPSSSTAPAKVGMPNGGYATNAANSTAFTNFLTVHFRSNIVVGASGSIIRGIISTTGSLDFGSISAASSADLTITVTGATVGDSVALGPPSAPTAGVMFWAFVSATDTVTVRASNFTAGSINPNAFTFRVTIHNFQ